MAQLAVGGNDFIETIFQTETGVWRGEAVVFGTGATMEASLWVTKVI